MKEVTKNHKNKHKLAIAQKITKKKTRTRPRETRKKNQSMKIKKKNDDIILPLELYIPLTRLSQYSSFSPAYVVRLLSDDVAG